MAVKLKNSPPRPFGFLLFMALSVLLVLCVLPSPCSARRSGGSGGSRSSSSSSSSSSRSSWGSSSRTASGSRSGTSSGTRYGSSSRSGSSSSRSDSGTRTQWGTSGSSGSGGTRYVSSGTSSGSSGRVGSRVSGSTYRVPISRTYSRISSGSSSVPRPQAQSPVSFGARSTPTRVVYSTTYVNNYGRMGGYGYYGGPYYGGGSFLRGYYLGFMMSRPYYPYYYDSYVPYRYHYGQYYYQTTPSKVLPTEQVRPVTPQKIVDSCTLFRWNREVPMTELPNMALEFLANDTISGSSVTKKSSFMYELFKSALEAYEHYNSSADVFATNESTRACGSTSNLFSANFIMIEAMSPRKMGELSTSFPSMLGEEPIVTAVRNVLYSYSNLSKSEEDLQDLVAAAKSCLPRGENVSQPEVLPCTDFSLTPDELLKLKTPTSIFQSEEICRVQLNRDIFNCTTFNRSSSGKCNVQHLLAINAFARDFYLCKNALEADTFAKLKSREAELGILMPVQAEDNFAEDTNNYQDSNVNNYEDEGYSVGDTIGIVAACVIFVVLIVVMVAKSINRRVSTSATGIVIMTENEPLNPHLDTSSGIQGYHPPLIVTAGFPPQPPETGPNNDLSPGAGLRPGPSPTGSPVSLRKPNLAPVIQPASSPKANKYGGSASSGKPPKS